MTEKRKLVVRAGLIAAGAGFIVFGLARGEAETVFLKAVQICMECIGIG